MERKGQAAMEFLITYGWAILAAIVAIGVLAYFLSSPGRLTANSCSVAAPWSCNAGAANTTTVSLEMRNGGGEAFNVHTVTVSGCGSFTTFTSFAADQLTVIPVICSPVLTAGTTFRGDITVTFSKSGSDLNQTTTGRIVQRL